MKYALMLWVMWFSWAAQAAIAPADITRLGEIPMLHEGRVKPISRVADMALLAVHGKATFEGNASTVWLAEAMMKPYLAIDKEVVLVRSKVVRSMLELPEKEGHLYSYREVTPAMEQQKEVLTRLAKMNQAKFTSTEKSLWQLYEAIDLFTQISGGLSLLLPQRLPVLDALRAELALPDVEKLSYLQMGPALRNIQERTKKLIEEKGDDFSRYSEQEQQLIQLSFHVSALQSIGKDNHWFRVMPSDWDEHWYAPWELVLSGKGSPATAALTAQWQQLASAYQEGDADAWNTAIDALNATLNAREDVQSWQLSLETLYYESHILLIVLVGYLLIVAVGFTRYAAKPQYRYFVYAMLALHALAIVARILILERPPVGTLYESVVFVSWVSAFWGAWIGFKKNQPEAVHMGAFLGAFLLAISDVYAGDGDSMGMLVAVLNTNFWLATHVICITAGYGCALLAGSVAHLCLWRKDGTLHKLLPVLTVIALLFTAVGTILGGVWADQSWGRFWGWDPKENGALLIVLWLVWLLHGGMAGVVGRGGFAALLAITNIIVALSWFGVNLLNVGLHSYGFTSEAAVGLAVFCVMELVLIALLYIRNTRVEITL